MNRHLARVIVMQTIYEWDFRPKTDVEEIKQRNIENYHEKTDDEYIKTTLGGVIKNKSDIDQEVVKAAPEWPLEQIASIDKAILRIAVFELLHSQDVPPKVAINEAVELGKTFGGSNSSKFINGVLGTVYRNSSRYNPADDQPKDDKVAQREANGSE